MENWWERRLCDYNWFTEASKPIFHWRPFINRKLSGTFQNLDFKHWIISIPWSLKLCFSPGPLGVGPLLLLLLPGDLQGWQGVPPGPVRLCGQLCWALETSKSDSHSKCHWELLEIELLLRCLDRSSRQFHDIQHLQVCGSDGNSYESHCHLHQAACRSDRHVTPLYSGFCR